MTKLAVLETLGLALGGLNNQIAGFSVQRYGLIANLADQKNRGPRRITHR